MVIKAGWNQLKGNKYGIKKCMIILAGAYNLCQTSFDTKGHWNIMCSRLEIECELIISFRGK